MLVLALVFQRPSYFREELSAAQTGYPPFVRPSEASSSPTSSRATNRRPPLSSGCRKCLHLRPCRTWACRHPRLAQFLPLEAGLTSTTRKIQRLSRRGSGRVDGNEMGIKNYSINFAFIVDFVTSSFSWSSWKFNQLCKSVRSRKAEKFIEIFFLYRLFKGK